MYKRARHDNRFDVSDDICPADSKAILSAGTFKSAKFNKSQKLYRTRQFSSDRAGQCSTGHEWPVPKSGREHEQPMECAERCGRGASVVHIRERRQVPLLGTIVVPGRARRPASATGRLITHIMPRRILHSAGYTPARVPTYGHGPRPHHWYSQHRHRARA